jgi:hypothetical protein
METWDGANFGRKRGHARKASSENKVPGENIFMIDKPNKTYYYYKRRFE